MYTDTHTQHVLIYITYMQLCASDMVHCASALMECPDKPFSEAFLEALEGLSRYCFNLTVLLDECQSDQRMSIIVWLLLFFRTNLQKIQAGIELAKQQVRTIAGRLHPSSWLMNRDVCCCQYSLTLYAPTMLHLHPIRLLFF